MVAALWPQHHGWLHALQSCGVRPIDQQAHRYSRPSTAAGQCSSSDHQAVAAATAKASGQLNTYFNTQFSGRAERTAQVNDCRYHLCRVQCCQNIRRIWCQVHELVWAVCCPGWLSLQIQRPLYVFTRHAPEQRAKPTVFIEVGQGQRTWTRCSFIRYCGELDLLS